MNYRDIRFEIDAGVATIRLHRPEQLNAFSGRMGEELGDAYRRCDADDEVRAVVLTGSGKAFCAGADMAGGSETFALREPAAFSASPVSPPAWEVRKPVIAAMNGHAIGLGLSLALQCDLQFAAQDARYGWLQVRRGVMPDAGSHWTLARVVGTQQAARLLLTGCKIDGREAARIGLALEALPADEVLPRALAMAREIKEQTAPLSVGLSKKLLWQAWTLEREEALRFETELHLPLMAGSDAVEGPMAWLERRTPRFSQRVPRDWPSWPRRRPRS
ncbi:MAG: enoyl-CoA hydratase-related protein [Myxococcota bacterium]|jgi:enoyl-CoA hydratase/carnithine racemase